MWANGNNPNGVAAQRWKGDTTPLGLKILRAATQGSSFLATLGFESESLWDSTVEFPKGITTNAHSDHSFTCTTFAGGNPLNHVAEALLYAPMFSE